MAIIITLITCETILTIIAINIIITSKSIITMNNNKNWYL